MTIGWEDSHSTIKRHVHTPITDAHGRNICSSCWQIIVEPIISSDDPRLKDAGLDRSVYDEESTTLGHDGAWPLPEILIFLYHHGPAQGLRKAPIAPYVEQVALLYAGIDQEDLWLHLANKV